MAIETQNTSARKSSMYLVRARKHQISKLAQAAEKESWGITLIQLAWTAGPAAFIALQSGYLLGYGHAAPMENIVYLAVYTLIAGFIGLLVRTITHFIQTRKQKDAHKKWLLLIDRLPELIVCTRDRLLSTHEPELKKRLAAIALVRKATSSPESIKVAMQDLSQDPKFAELSAEIALHRGSGMNCRAEDLLNEHQQYMEGIITQLKSALPDAAAAVEQRLKGNIPGIKEGVPRKEGFIDRILQAAEEDNKSLISLKDVEEILILAFELLAGRKILMLTFRYRGRRALTEAADALELAHDKYGIAIANFHSRLHNLINFLVECGALEAGEVSEESDAKQLLLLSEKAIDGICEGIYQLYLSHQNKYSTIIVLNIQTEILSTALDYYQSLRRSYQRIHRRQQVLARNVQRWSNICKHHKNATVALRSGRGQGGLRIIEKKIHLDDKEKLQAAKILAPHFYNTHYQSQGQTRSKKSLTANALKEIAIETALALEQFIPLANPSVRFAIESSNATNIDGFNPEFSAMIKAGLSTTFINEIRSDVSKTAEHLARVLTQHYGIELTPSAVDFLHHTYGVHKEILEELALHPHLKQSLPEVSPEREIPQVPNAKKRWLKSLERAKGLLKPL